MKNNIFKYHFTCWIPRRLDLLQLLEKNPIDVSLHKNNPQKILDRLAFVIGACVNATKSSRSSEFSLCSGILQNSVRDYKKYLTYLLGEGIIVKLAQGMKGISCTRYKFGAEICLKKPRKHVILDRAFLKVIYSKKRKAAVIKKYQVQYDHLQHLEINWEQAEHTLLHLYGNKENNETKMARQRQRLYAIEDIRMATFKVNSTNRLYTTICNLHQGLRSSLLFYGKSIVGIDIRNSIPFFSLALLSQVFFKQGLDTTLCKINPKLCKKRTTRQEEGKNEPWLMLVEIADRNDTEQHEDIPHYRRAVTEGNLYEQVMKEFNAGEEIKQCYDRKKTKRKILEILNSPPAHRSKEKDVLFKMYPNVMSAFEEINDGFTKTRKGRGKSRWQEGDQICAFAHLTQRFEAMIVLDRIGSILAKKKIPYLTLHDCVFTVKGKKDEVEKIMESEIKKIMGITPQFKITNYE